MIVQSNIQLVKTPQRWIEGQFIYYFNHKDNGVQLPEQEGRRYEAEFIIIKSDEVIKTDIKKALVIAILDIVHNQKIIDNIEIEGKPAIEVKKVYNITPATTTAIEKIITDNEKVQEWQEKTEYKEGMKVTFKGETFICLKSHLSEAGKTPDLIPELWKKESLKMKSK